jgi:hypothetical protein
MTGSDSNSEIIFYIASVLNIATFFMYNIIALRILSSMGALLFVITAIIWNLDSMIIANSIIFFINIFYLVLEYINRKTIILKKEEKEIYEMTFLPIYKKEFLKLYHLAKFKTFTPNSYLLTMYQEESILYLIIKGTVVIQNGSTIICELTKGQFIGEMHFLLGEPFSANAVSKTEVVCLAWEDNNFQKLRALKQKNMDLYLRLQFIILRALIKKLHKDGRI